MSGRIVICGAVAQKPNQAGHTWQFLQYLVGFQELGFDVLLVDRLRGPVERTDRRVAYLREVMRAAGLEQAWTIGLDDGSHIGRPRNAVLDCVHSADFLVNVMGFCDDEEIMDTARRRVFLDTDPGFAQMWRELELADALAGHDAHVTIGERIGESDCTIPTCGLDWITTPQPVVLSHWPAADFARGPVRFTSVASWRGAYGPVDFGGHRYGLRVHEFRQFAALPALTGAQLEVALHIDAADDGDLQLLRAAGWNFADPRVVAATPQSYRRYIQQSSAELMVAKGMYVDTRSGWLSERSLCYLASGRPVLAQSTGAESLYPLGRGLLTFETIAEAAAGVEAITADYGGHARAARDLAVEYFDSKRVLSRLVEQLDAVRATARAGS
jgi:hypothetical protein